MNVDVLANNPRWGLYVAFSVPFMVLVLLGWVLFKYVPVSSHPLSPVEEKLTRSQIASWIEKNIGARLERKPDTAPSSPVAASTTTDEKTPSEVHVDVVPSRANPYRRGRNSRRGDEESTGENTYVSAGGT